MYNFKGFIATGMVLSATLGVVQVVLAELKPVSGSADTAVTVANQPLPEAGQVPPGPGGADQTSPPIPEVPTVAGGSDQTSPAVAPVPEVAQEPLLDAAAVEALKGRLRQRWDKLMAGQFRDAYAMTAPAYREKVPYEEFALKYGRKVGWRKIDDLLVTPRSKDSALVGFTLYFDFYDLHSSTKFSSDTYLEEDWVWVDGEWWHSPPLAPPKKLKNPFDK